MVSISDFLEIPSNCIIDKVIAKEKFYDNLKSKDQQIFQKFIRQIRWHARLAEDNTRIIPYNDETRRYNEVEVISIVLKDENLKELTDANKVNNAYFVQDKKIDRILDITFRFITFPQLIVMQYRNKVKLCVTHLTINQADSSKFTLDEIISTNWMNLNTLNDFEKSLIKKIQLDNLSHENFYMFYSDIVDSVIQYNGSLLVGKKVDLSVERIKWITDRIKELEKEIKVLQRELKNETQHPLRSKINNEIRNRRIEIRDLKEELEQVIC